MTAEYFHYHFFEMGVRNNLNFNIRIVLFLLLCDYGKTQVNQQPTIAELEQCTNDLVKAEDEVWGLQRANNKVPDSQQEKTDLENRKKEAQAKLEEAKKDQTKQKQLIEYLKSRNEALTKAATELLDELEKKNDTSKYGSDINKLKVAQENLKKNRDLAETILKRIEDAINNVTPSASQMNCIQRIINFIKSLIKAKMEFVKRALRLFRI